MARTPSTMVDLGTVAPPFTLPDPSGQTHSLSDVPAGAPVLVVFMSNHCPFVKHLQREFAMFVREYQARGLHVFGINANDVVAYPADAPPLMAAESERVGYTFPYLFDESQDIAKAYAAACTPDFFLFDGDRKLVYRGQFDSSRPGLEVPVTGSDLRSACDAVLEGREPQGEQTPSLGCNIKWRRGNEPAYFG